MFASRTNWKLEPNRLAVALADHRRRGYAIFDLTISNPTFCGFEYPAHEILAALSDSRAIEYEPESKGRRDAREAIAGYYSERRGFAGPAGAVNSDRVLLVSGTSEAYSHIFRLLCEPGDEVLVPAPSYPLLEFLADLADVRLVPYPLFYDHGWQMDLDALRAVVTPRSRAVLVVHPNNPTGSFVSPREAAELTEICNQHEMAIIADEVFLDYRDGGQPEPASFAAHGGALTFTLSGLSKISALPQMKLAWVVVSGPDSAASAAAERLDVIADTYLSVGTPVQLALPRLVGLRQGIQEQVRKRVAANLAGLDAALQPALGIGRLNRAGGWYAILRVPVATTDEDLAVTLLEREAVLAHPGSFYNFNNDGHLVVSLIAREAIFAEGLRRLLRFFE